MPSRIDDRWVWLGFSLLTIVAVRSVRNAFTELIPLLKINHHAYEPKPIPPDQQYPQDRISLSDLKTLCESPNDNIAAAATSILVQRYARDEKAKDLVHEDLHSADPETRAIAKRAMEFVNDGWLPDSYSRFAERGAHSYEPLGSAEDDREHVPVVLTPSRVEEAVRLADEILGRRGGEGVVVPSWADPVAGWARVPHERGEVEELVEDEWERRRRRREAVVVGGSGEVDGIN